MKPPLLDEGDWYWEGNLEICDLCGDFYPMCWIVYNGIQFLCYKCYYDEYSHLKPPAVNL